MRLRAACVRALAATMVGAALVALAGCVTLPDNVAFELRPPEAAERQSFGHDVAAGTAPSPRSVERRELDARELPLGHGQIIVSEVGGPMSLFYSLFAVDYAPWVHAGIVAIEDGKAVVYEANGNFFPIPGLPPTTTISGAVRRVGVERFLRGNQVVGLYALPLPADAERLVAYAREQHRLGTPFDPYFDSDDAAALYCTELVARGLAAAGVASVPATALHEQNPSLAVARDWLRLRSHGVYLAGRLVEAGVEVGRWSPELSRSQIEAYFAAKRELHRRFDDSARLGHVFRWTGRAMRLREPVQRFIDDALALAVAEGIVGSDVAAGVERLARARFDAIDDVGGIVMIAATPRSVPQPSPRTPESPWMPPPIEPSSSTPKP